MAIQEIYFIAGVLVWFYGVDGMRKMLDLPEDLPRWRVALRGGFSYLFVLGGGVAAAVNLCIILKL